MELLFHVQIGGIFELLVDEIDLARIALSCHFAFDVCATRKVLTIPHDALSGTIARGESLLWNGTEGILAWKQLDYRTSFVRYQETQSRVSSVSWFQPSSWT